MRARGVINNVAAVLRRRQWSQADLAAVSEIPYGIVRRLARPGSNPPLEYVLRIARALDTPVEHLFSLADDRERTAVGRR